MLWLVDLAKINGFEFLCKDALVVLHTQATLTINDCVFAQNQAKPITTYRLVDTMLNCSCIRKYLACSRKIIIKWRNLSHLFFCMRCLYTLYFNEQIDEYVFCFIHTYTLYTCRSRIKVRLDSPRICKNESSLFFQPLNFAQKSWRFWLLKPEHMN